MFNKEMFLKAKEHSAAFLESTPNLKQTQDSLLSSILKQNQDCCFGREYNFSKIKNYTEFKNSVPLSVFSDYQESIDRIVSGEDSVLYSGGNYQFVSSSGTTEKPKIIPMSLEFATQAFIPFYLTYLGQLATHYPEFLMNADKTVNFKLDPGKTVAKLENGAKHAGLSQISFGDDFKDGALFEPGTGAIWSDIPADIENDLERIYFRLRVSVEHEIKALIGINPAIIHSIEYLLRGWSTRLISDVREGTLNGEKFSTRNPEVASRLQKIETSRGHLLPKDLWPNLSHVVCWKEGVSKFYMQLLNDTFGEHVVFLSAPLAASEAPVAIPLFDKDERNLLAYQSVFYEFLDITTQHSDNIVLADALEVNKSYAVIVTQQSGFYRYITGDLIRVTGFINGVPTVEYSGRYSQKQTITDDVLLGAVLDLSSILDSRIRNFTFKIPQKKANIPTKLTFKVELEKRPNKDRITQIQQHLEAYLIKHSDHYQSERNQDKMNSLEVDIVDADTFFREWVGSVNSGKRPPQVKDKVSTDC